jgi:hypothetical protein
LGTTSAVGNHLRKVGNHLSQVGKHLSKVGNHLSSWEPSQQLKTTSEKLGNTSAVGNHLSKGGNHLSSWEPPQQSWEPPQQLGTTSDIPISKGNNFYTLFYVYCFIWSSYIFKFLLHLLFSSNLSKIGVTVNSLTICVFVL